MTLKKPWIKNADLLLKFFPWLWKYCPDSCLEFQGFTRLNLENPWPLNSDFSLPWPWIENSKIRSRTSNTLKQFRRFSKLDSNFGYTYQGQRNFLKSGGPKQIYNIFSMVWVKRGWDLVLVGLFINNYSLYKIAPYKHSL